MKKVIGMLAVLAFGSSMASAELLKNLKYDGSLEVNSVTGQKSLTPGKSDFSNINSRLMLGLNFDLNEDLNAQVTAVKSDYRYYGTNSQTVNDLENNITFAEAYVNMKNVLWINHKVGRQFYGKAGDIVIYYGPSYQNTGAIANYTVSSLDGWYGEWNKDKWMVTGLAGKVSENSLISPLDKNLYGVTGSYAFSEIVKPAVYIYQSDDRSLGKHDTLDVIGVKAEGKYEGVGYKAEYAMDAGKNKNTMVKYTGSALKVNADYGLDLKAAGKFNFMGEFAMGSGDKASATKNEGFTAISGNYLPGMIYGAYGVGATNGLNNLTTFNVGANYTPKQVEKLTVCAKFFNFAYTEKTATTATPAGATAIGNELDLGATWKHSENVSIKASYAMFSPNKKFMDHSAETLMGLNLNLKF